MTTAKRLDRKLAKIEAGQYTPQDFIIADAKDGDMALGTGTAGPELDEAGRPTDRMRPLKVYRDNMEVMVESDLIDIMLTSLSSGEYLARRSHRPCECSADIGMVRTVRHVKGWAATRGKKYRHDHCDVRKMCSS